MDTETAQPKNTGPMAKTIGYCVAFVALGLVMASLGPTLTGLAEHTRTHLSEISVLFTARALGYLIGSFQGGRLYDRVPGHPVMAAGLLVMAATMALVPAISWLWLLAAVLLVLGAAEGTVDVGGNTLLVWVHGHQVGPFMNGLHFFFGLGAFLAPIIVAQAVLVSGDIAWAYWALALLVLPVTAWLLRLPSPAGQVNRPSTEITAQPALPLERLPSGNSRQIGRTARGRPLAALIVSFFFLYAGAEASFGGWIFSYAVAMDLSSEAAAATRNMKGSPSTGVSCGHCRPTQIRSPKRMNGSSTLNQLMCSGGRGSSASARSRSVCVPFHPSRKMVRRAATTQGISSGRKKPT